MDVIAAIQRDSSKKGVATALNISISTVQFHRANIMRKFGTDKIVNVLQMLVTKKGLEIDPEGIVHAVKELSMHDRFTPHMSLRIVNHQNLEERLYERLMSRFSQPMFSNSGENGYRASEMKLIGAPFGMQKTPKDRVQ